MGSREIGDPEPGRPGAIRSALASPNTSSRRNRRASPAESLAGRFGRTARRRPLQCRAVTEAPQGPKDPAKGLNVGFVPAAEHGHETTASDPSATAWPSSARPHGGEATPPPSSAMSQSAPAIIDEGIAAPRSMRAFRSSADFSAAPNPLAITGSTAPRGRRYRGLLQGLGRGHHELGHGVDELDQLGVERRRRIGLLNRDRRARRPSVAPITGHPGIHLDAGGKTPVSSRSSREFPTSRRGAVPRLSSSASRTSCSSRQQGASAGWIFARSARSHTRSGPGRGGGRCGSQGSMVTRCTGSESWNGSSTSAGASRVRLRVPVVRRACRGDDLDAAPRVFALDVERPRLTPVEQRAGQIFSWRYGSRMRWRWRPAVRRPRRQEGSATRRRMPAPLIGRIGVAAGVLEGHSGDPVLAPYAVQLDGGRTMSM